MSISRIIKDPVLYAIILMGRMLPDTISADAFYLKMLYRHYLVEKLNLKNPVTYNEKLQWMKLYNRRPEYTMMVDKYEAKKYVSKILGEEYVIPTLGVWDKYEDIDFDQLPDQFVLKCTHDSGGLVICTDKSHFDQTAAKKKINHALKRKYYKNTREWPYKNVHPRIIAEAYMVDESGYELKDYKFFTFNGVMKIMFIAMGRNSSETYTDFFDRDFNHLPIEMGHYNAPHTPGKPVNFEKMIEFSERLSEGLPHARIDFYNINGNIYFGEITFFHMSGFKPVRPGEWNCILGEWLSISERN